MNGVETLVIVAASLLIASALASKPLDYEEIKASLSGLKAQARKNWETAPAAGKAKALADARAQLLEAFDKQLFPAWLGTPWDFYGTSQTPQTGQIACGYFVSTLIRDAGFRVERVKLAQQASTYIARTLAPPGTVKTYRGIGAEEAVNAIRRDFGEGLFVVGLPFHVGFLRVKADDVRFCHSGVLAPTAVACEEALTSATFDEKLFVVGRLFDDALLEAWLEDRPLPTVTR